MTLPKEIYRELEDIVGSTNISDDPVLCDSYAFEWLAETARPNQSRFMPRAVAVLMPGSVEEVQAIVKAGNRHKIKVKAHSTGWHFYGVPQKDDCETIQLDLRRMDRILEIDEKNMFVVIEPYVVCGTLQAELLKLGLDINIIGGGASTSPLANTTSYSGTGETSIWTGSNSENLLALEWVTPRGDIQRTGSLTCGAGWFCGEGPGPSLRGICRGKFGARGGLGIYTKIALKLSHWPGPPGFSVKGTAPAYRATIPENVRVYCIGFPSWQNYADAFYKIFDNEIGYIWSRQYAMMGGDIGPAFWLLYNDPTKTLSDIEEMVQKPEVKKLTEEMKRAFQIVLVGHSAKDIEYQDKVLNQILAETGGWKIARMSEPDMAEFTYLFMHRAGQRHVVHAYAGGWTANWALLATPDYAIRYHPWVVEGGNRDQQSGLLVQCGADSTVGPGSAIGGGGITGFEQLAFFDPADKESVKAAVKLMYDGMKDQIEHGYPIGRQLMYMQVGMTDEEIHSYFARASQPLVYHLQGKIKQMLDPNDIGDRLYAHLPEPKE